MVCYCCVGYERPCLQSPPTYRTFMHNQSFGDNSQSSSVLPPIAQKEVNNHRMRIPAQVNKPPKMDLSDWEITSTEFCPRQRKLASKPIGAGAHPTPPPAMESVKKK